MAQSLSDALKTLSIASPLVGKWYVGIFVINPIPKPGQCGLYSFHSIYDTQKSAEEVARSLNETHGHSCVTFRARPMGQFYEFDETAVTTLFHSNDAKDESINKLMEARAEAQHKAEARKAALAAQMTAETQNPDAQLSQLIYQAQFNDTNAASNRAQIEKMETVVVTHKAKITAMLAANHKLRNTWKVHIKPVLQEHDDSTTYEYMTAWFDSNFK
jgi:hypothetical protein